MFPAVLEGIDVMWVRRSLRHLALRAARRIDVDLWRYLMIRPFVLEVIPDHVEQLDPEGYVPAPVVVGAGVDLRETDQLTLLTSWRGRFSSLFASLREDPQINTMAIGRPYLHNGFYPTPDAEVYAAMIAERVPRRIVEIGAGFSTRIARRTISEIASDTELVIIDPEPRADISGVADTIFLDRFEDIDRTTLGLDGRTLLFVDSSHIVSAGGDVTDLFCRVIPELPPGVLIHFHDIFLPYDYPPAYVRRLYTEQYVLWALLARGSMFRVVFATHFMTRNHTAAMQQVFGSVVGVDELYFGGSFWVEAV
ncbi:MAG: hypothetical protein JO168_23065 [Solirubrobacterales bacterium]|nr:hypothetical protein [Solirubrobacterales bacterium]MBV9714554.1 hypothetical protein [Solirubrobacterales bacterium]